MLSSPDYFWGFITAIESKVAHHLSDLHISRIPSNGAILLPVACIAHQLAVPDPEVSSARAALGEHCDG